MPGAAWRRGAGHAQAPGRGSCSSSHVSPRSGDRPPGPAFREDWSPEGKAPGGGVSGAFGAPPDPSTFSPASSLPPGIRKPTHCRGAMLCAQCCPSWTLLCATCPPGVGMCRGAQQRNGPPGPGVLGRQCRLASTFCLCSLRAGGPHVGRTFGHCPVMDSVCLSVCLSLWLPLQAGAVQRILSLALSDPSSATSRPLPWDQATGDPSSLGSVFSGTSVRGRRQSLSTPRCQDVRSALVTTGRRPRPRQTLPEGHAASCSQN